jgi:hypothetical protein
VVDPFAADCEGEKTECLESEAALKAELATSKADSVLLKDILALNCK